MHCLLNHADMTDLSTLELTRYSRQISLPQIGVGGQKKLKEASVLIVGAGGLGSPVALYLAAAGIGRLGLIDFDRVDATNLHRQILHGTGDVGRPKVESARARIAEANPEVEVRTWQESLTVENVAEIVRQHDVIVDGTDNFPTRYLVSDACVLLGKPNVYGSVFRFEGQASLFDARSGPCYRCLYPTLPPKGMVPSCEEGGVLGVVPGIIGLIQAAETMKLITGAGETLIGRLLLFDGLTMRFRQMMVPKNANCPSCGDHPTITSLRAEEWSCETETSVADEMTPDEVSRAIEAGEGPFLLDVREGYEWEISRLEGATLIPLRTLDVRLSELPRDRHIVVYCRSGARSARAVAMLRERGFGAVSNLVGGINRWAREIDPSLRIY
jgi:adenylyltransferase/sulfurtransferase